jgi:type IV pilus assembly protein PilB
MKKKRLGEVLVERGTLTSEDLAQALREQEGTATLLGDLLLARGAVPRDQLAAALREVLHVDYIDVKKVEIDHEILKMIPRDVAERNVALPMFVHGRHLVVAMADPQNMHSLNELRFTCGMDILPRLSFRDEIGAAIENFYGGQPVEGAQKLLEIEETEAINFEISTPRTPDANREALKELRSQNQRTPAVRIVSAVIATAAREKASDIHVDPQQGGAVVRIRVDGMLRDIMEVPLDLQAALISRIKILGDMDIAERRAPQDGRVLVRIGKDKIDLRVSTLPTQYGEKAVIRLLNPDATKVSFVELGFSKEISKSLERILAQPQGMLLVTGPTGSGKTTTLYAAVNQMRSRTKNIITVEDPVEYVLEGINQVQVHTKAGRTFVSCLRSILRQDPNVIMVGEIRDLETAEIALRASQTGHMVLSTLHTNDSVAAIVRLLDIGIPPFLIASSVSGVIAQRLVRKLCNCRKEVDLSPEFGALLLTAGIQDFKESFGESMYVPNGCTACNGTGYKGRVGIYEILFVNEQTRSSIRAGANPDEIRRMARIEGMKMMYEEAIAKAKTGATSLAEVFRVIPFESVPAAVGCANCNRYVAPTYLFCPHCGEDRRAAQCKTDGKAPQPLQEVGEPA